MNQGKQPSVRLVVACHKACPVPGAKIYLPLHVGSAGKPSIGFQRDDEGENISAKNPEYCELTGLYWAWKHLPGQWIGLVHYRRYFSATNKLPWDRKPSMECVLTEEEFQRLSKGKRILVPKKRHYYIETIYQHYGHTLDHSHLDAARDVLQVLHPESLEAFDTFMRARSGYMFNMMIMERELLEAYCQWLFPVLEELERRIDSSGMTAFERRWVGRVAERLFNVWLMEQERSERVRRDQILELPYLYLGNVDWGRKIVSFLQAKLLHKKYEKSF